jgi:hypothetical protein
VEVTLTPEEMEGLDEAGLKALYEEKVSRGSRCKEGWAMQTVSRSVWDYYIDPYQNFWCSKVLTCQVICGLLVIG